MGLGLSFLACYRSLLAPVETPRLGPIAAIAHVTPAAAVVAAHIHEQPAAIISLALADPPQFLRGQ